MQSGSGDVVADHLAGDARIKTGSGDIRIVRADSEVVITTGSGDVRVEQASEEELANAAAAADRTGMFNCPHTGVALAVLTKLVQRGDITSRDRVVVVSTANGLKFTDFKLKYHEGALESVRAEHARRPVELPNDYDAVRRAIDQA